MKPTPAQRKALERFADAEHPEAVWQTTATRMLTTLHQKGWLTHYRITADGLRAIGREVKP